jgi:hypothetical protein
VISLAILLLTAALWLRWRARPRTGDDAETV